MSSRFARAHSSGNKFRLRRLLLLSYVITVATVLPMSFSLLYDPAFVITIMFGEEFRDASKILEILVYAQIAITVVTPLIVMLNMTGVERTIAKINMVTLSVLLLLCVFFAVRLEGQGVAWARMIAFILLGSLVIAQFRKHWEGLYK